MKVILFLAIAITAVCFSQESHALPASNLVSGPRPNGHRLFNSTQTDATVGCSLCTNTSCTNWFVLGYYPSGAKCQAPNRTGGISNEAEQQAANDQPSESSNLDQVFSANDDRSAAFWGYVTATIRSPNGGRTLMKDAMLDICIGFTNLDSLVTNYASDPYGGWSACTGSGYCGSTKNAYCTANSNQVCLDRCNCKYQSALVGLGYADPGCSNL